MRVGVDCGLQGAIALLMNDFQLLEVTDMPIMAKSKNKNQVNPAVLATIMDKYQRKYRSDITVYVEAVSAMPGQGVSSMFGFGVSFGIVQGVVAAVGLPMVLVTPVAWKRRAGLLGKPKDFSRTICQRLYPGADIARKKDIGRAEAILIAKFGGA